MDRRQKHQRESSFGFEQLETRRVLDAHFLISGSLLILNDVDTRDTLTISEDASTGAYLFELTNGVWDGVDGDGVYGNKLKQLRVEKTAVNPLSGGIQIGEIADHSIFDTVFESVDFSELNGLLQLNSTSIQQANGSTLTTDSIRFKATDALAIATNANFRAYGGALIRSSADIEIGREVAEGHPAAARIDGPARFNSGSNLNFIGNSRQLSFSSAGDSFISDASALTLFGKNRAGGSLRIESNGTLMSDRATDISAREMSLSGKQIRLGTSAKDTIQISEKTSIVSTHGFYIAPQADVHFNEFQFNTGGFIHVNLDSNTSIFGNNSADSIFISTTGTVSDTPSTIVQSNGNLELIAKSISMAGNSENELVAHGRATFNAPQGIAIGAAVSPGDPNAAKVSFGQLEFISDDSVSISESDGIYFVGVNRANEFTLRSGGYILNAPGLDLISTGAGRFESNVGIYLGDDISDKIHLCGGAVFTAPQQVIINAASSVKTPIYNATSDHVDIYRDADSCHATTTLEQLNEILPDDWSFRLFDDGPDIRLVTYDAHGNVANRARFGSTGIISQLSDARNGRNLLAPTYQGEVTDRTIQWTFWELGQNAVYDHPNLPSHKDRFNLTQAGTFENLLNETIEVELDSESGQLDVWSVVDNLWSIQQAPFMQGYINTLTRTQVLDGGAMLVRRVTMMGETLRLGQELSVDIPYIEAWSPFADSAFNALTTSIDSQGNPDVWFANGYNIPTYPKVPVDETRGWAMVYDRFDQKNSATMSVIFGKNPGKEHRSDGSSIEPRFFRYNSMDFDTGMVINPGLSAWNLPAGSLIDQHYLFLPGQGMNSGTPVMLDGLAERLPAPQIYHPGANLPKDVADIANHLTRLNQQSGIPTDHIGTLL